MYEEERRSDCFRLYRSTSRVHLPHTS